MTSPNAVCPRSSRRFAFPLFVGLLFLPFAIGLSKADARIAVGKGIAGVEIGDTMGHVRAVLGKPQRIVPPDWKYGRPLRGSVGFDRREVNDVWTTAKSQRTKKGIGPGSSLKAAKHSYPRLRCFKKAGRWRTLCKIVSAKKSKGRVHTVFLFRKRLAVVDVFFVPFGTRSGPS